MFHSHRGSLCELGFPVVGRQGLKVPKKPHFPFNVTFFYPKTKFRTVLRYFELLFYYIITFFLTKKSNGSPGSAGSAGSAGFAGSGGSTVC